MTGNGKQPARRQPPPADAAGVQATVEGVTLTDSVEFAGQRFRVADNIGAMPLLKFSHEASAGLTEDSVEGMAAMYALIRDCIWPGEPCTCGVAQPRYAEHAKGCSYVLGDWERFERAAIDGRATAEDLFDVVNRVMEVLGARPTQRSGGSAPPEQPGSPKSKASSPARGSRRVVPGRAEPQAAGLMPVADLAPRRSTG